MMQLYAILSNYEDSLALPAVSHVVILTFLTDRRRQPRKHAKATFSLLPCVGKGNMRRLSSIFSDP
jgi:hypothetical protein